VGSKGGAQQQRDGCVSRGECVLHRQYKGLEKAFFVWLGSVTGLAHKGAAVSGVDIMHAAVDQVIYGKAPVPLPMYECLVAAICLRQETAKRYFGGGDDGHDFFLGVLLHLKEKLLPLVVNEYHPQQVKSGGAKSPVVADVRRHRRAKKWNATRKTVQAHHCWCFTPQCGVGGGKENTTPVAAVGSLRQKRINRMSTQGQVIVKAHHQRGWCLAPQHDLVRSGHPPPLARAVNIQQQRQRKVWGVGGGSVPAAGVWEFGPDRIWTWRCARNLQVMRLFN